jgi:16S rRNA (guanine(527)-N(7))-methyltransferase RsmG
MIEINSKEVIDKYLDLGKLEKYLDLVEDANRKINLYSRNIDRLELRVLVAESIIPIQLGMISPESGHILDIGSGWGIPSIPLLLWDQELKITLVERSQKKADFLNLTLSRLGLRAAIVNSDMAHVSNGDKFSIVTLRQVAIDKFLFDSIKPHITPDAKLVYFGPSVDEKSFTEVTSTQYQIDRKPARTLIAAKFSQK